MIVIDLKTVNYFYRWVSDETPLHKFGNFTLKRAF